MSERIHHYMVEYENEDGKVVFANDTEIVSLTAAKSLASKISGTTDFYGAYVVAFAQRGSAEPFVAIGHISFFDGKQSETDGVVINS